MQVPVLTPAVAAPVDALAEAVLRDIEEEKRRSAVTLVTERHPAAPGRVTARLPG